jgi:hypothetical protein
MLKLKQGVISVRQWILFIVLGLVILLVIYTFGLRPRTNRAVNYSKSKGTQTVKPQETKAGGLAKSESRVSKSETTLMVTKKVSPANIESIISRKTTRQWGRDPFVRDWVRQDRVTDLKLKAITIANGKAYALINDQILEVGEEIQGHRILRIAKDYVVLKYGEREIELYLGQ